MQEKQLLNLPKYPVTSIPSGGISYPEDWSIEISPYTFGQSSGIKETSVAHKRFYNIVLDGVYTNFDKSQLILEDILYLSIARKLISSQSSKITLTTLCPVCLTENKLSDEIVNLLKFESSKITNRSKYPIKVTFSKYIGWYRYLTLDENLSILNNDSIKNPISTNIAMRTVKLVEITGNSEESEKVIYDENTSSKSKPNIDMLKNIYESFIDEDSAILDELISVFESMKLLPIEVTCSEPTCKNVYKKDLNIGALTDFLSPFCPDRGTKIKDSIDL